MAQFNSNTNSFKEAVCIEAMRVFDSCSDKDCIEDLEVSFLNAQDRECVENASFIKSKSVEVVNTVFGMESVPFNKGFYSVDLTYTFCVDIEAFTNTSLPSTTVKGVTSFSKKVILYGSDGNTKYFNSEDPADSTLVSGNQSIMPVATVSVVEPIALDCKLVSKYPFGYGHDNPNSAYRGNSESDDASRNCKKVPYITIGLFSIIQLSRPVPILVPAYEYCIPDDNQRSASSDSPCELFDKIKFPANEFFPRSLEETEMLTGNTVSTAAAMATVTTAPTAATAPTTAAATAATTPTTATTTTSAAMPE